MVREWLMVAAKISMTGRSSPVTARICSERLAGEVEGSVVLGGADSAIVLFTSAVARLAQQYVIYSTAFDSNGMWFRLRWRSGGVTQGGPPLTASYCRRQQSPTSRVFIRADQSLSKLWLDLGQVERSPVRVCE
jgi:hypothetical protein